MGSTTSSRDMETGCASLLKALGSTAYYLVGVQIEGGRTLDLLPKKGEWIEGLWRAVHQRLPTAVGCRAGWDTACFVIDTSDVAILSQTFKELLSSLKHPIFTNFCCILRTSGVPAQDVEHADAIFNELSNMASVHLYGKRGYVSHGEFDVRLINGVAVHGPDE